METVIERPQGLERLPTADRLENADFMIQALPFDPELKRRIRMSVFCQDCDDLPKVSGAGQTFDGRGPNAGDGPYRYQRMHNGLRVIEDCYHGKGITEIIRLLHGHHEPQEEKAFESVLAHFPPGSTMIELGSHWSYYSLWFNRHIKDAQNYMIEPDPANLEAGRRNFTINGLKGSFHNYSVGNVSLEARPFECESDNVIRPLEQICVDDFVEKNSIPFVDLLFADIQGYEFHMLQGAARSIREKRIRFIFVSTHHHLISHDPIIHHRCLEFIKDHGGHIILSHTISESFSGDGLIVASFDPRDRDFPEIKISRNYPTASLFREVEYDLADAYQEIKTLKGQLADAKRPITSLNLPTPSDLQLSEILNSRSWKAVQKIKRFRALLRKTTGL